MAFYSQVRFANGYQAMAPHLAALWTRVSAMGIPQPPFDPDLARYAALDIAGALRSYLATEAGPDTETLGFLTYVVSTDLHSAKTWQATCDLIWLDPSAAVSEVPLCLFRFAEDSLRAEGVKWIQTAFSTPNPALARLLSGLGHQETHSMYTRNLASLPKPSTWTPGLSL